MHEEINDITAKSEVHQHEYFDQIDADELAALIESKRKQIYSRLRYAIINAIPHEHASTISVFGKSDPIPCRDDPENSITYVKIKNNNGTDMYIVLSGTTGQGIAQAAAATAIAKSRCPSLQKVLLVGIAAGQPNLSDKEKDVRLGDVVVGQKLIQYDHLKRTNGAIELRGDNIAPGDQELIASLEKIRALQEFSEPNHHKKPWMKYISSTASEVRNALRPDEAKDPNTKRRKYSKGTEYERPNCEPFIHVGTIGSASTLLKDKAYRDELNKEYGTIAYEMEGAGVAISAAATGIGYLNVRGICDYGDEEKNDLWQTYAGTCAAAVARSIIENL